MSKRCFNCALSALLWGCELKTIALPTTVVDLIEEYDAKLADVSAAIADLKAARDRFDMGCTVQGTYVERVVDHPTIWEEAMRKNLLKSGWRAIYNRLRIADIATAKDKLLFDKTMADPPPLTFETAKATFAGYLLNPREHILRGLAEVFCQLDPAYKSHSKVKIGVKGLPKRIILTYFGGWGGNGENQLRDIVNALASFQRKPHIEWAELRMVKNKAENGGEFAMDGSYFLDKPRGADKDAEPPRAVDRGITVRGYLNGNAHLIFDKTALLDINRALAEYYGDILPDAEPENVKPSASTAVSKDLQFYWTPPEVVEEVLNFANVWRKEQFSGERPALRILEPSCGDGRILDAIRQRGFRGFGIEYHPGRAAECKAKGHAVLTANFLEQPPQAEFDRVVMNPPFYGKHWAKHVRHAFKFLKPGGVMVAILPATAQYDNSDLIADMLQTGQWADNPWRDLPVGSFAAAGTNVSTCMLRLRSPATPPRNRR